MFDSEDIAFFIIVGGLLLGGIAMYCCVVEREDRQQLLMYEVHQPWMNTDDTLIDDTLETPPEISSS